MGRAFSPLATSPAMTWAVGPGWYGPRRWRSGVGSDVFLGGGPGPYRKGKGVKPYIPSLFHSYLKISLARTQGHTEKGPKRKRGQTIYSFVVSFISQNLPGQNPGAHGKGAKPWHGAWQCISEDRHRVALELHQPLRLCRPSPELPGQRDRETVGTAASPFRAAEGPVEARVKPFEVMPITTALALPADLALVPQT